MNTKTNAFTLAEVLITLSILGVIAALTIPNIINHYKKLTTEVRLKQAYSILSQAITMVQLEYKTKDIYGSTKGDYLVNRLAKQLNVSGVCMSNDRIGKNDPCPPIDKVADSSRNVVYGNLYLNRWWYDIILLKNNMIFYIGRKSTFVQMYVDINGTKGPNKMGIDLFSFGYITPQYTSDTKRKGTFVPGREGDHNWPVWGDINKMNCGVDGPYGKKTGSDDQDYSGCAAVIMRNGWKIPKDYPFKWF